MSSEVQVPKKVRKKKLINNIKEPSIKCFKKASNESNVEANNTSKLKGSNAPTNTKKKSVTNVKKAAFSSSTNTVLVDSEGSKKTVMTQKVFIIFFLLIRNKNLTIIKDIKILFRV